MTRNVKQKIVERYEQVVSFTCDRCLSVETNDILPSQWADIVYFGITKHLCIFCKTKFEKFMNNASDIEEVLNRATKQFKSTYPKDIPHSKWWYENRAEIDRYR